MNASEPPSVTAHSELQRFRLMVGVAFVGTLAVLLMDWLALGEVLILTPWLSFAGIGMSWALAHRGRVGLATHLFAGVLLGVIIQSGWRYGGVNSGLMHWLLLPFLAIVLTRDIRQSLPWAVVALPAAALIAQSPHDTPVAWVRMVGSMIFMAIVMGGVLLFVRAKLSVMQRLSDTVDALNREVEQRRIAEERALSAERAKSEFLATMSHEIRTPLNGVLGMTDLLSEADLPATQASQVGVLQQSGQLLMRVVTEVLDLSKLEAGLSSLEPQPVQLGALVQGVVALHRPSASSKGLTLDVASFLDLPAWVSVDGARLQQVLGNLLLNAIHHTESGGILVGMSWEEGLLSLSVTDTGPGISEQAKARIFERYSGSRKETGTGLGLAIVWQICKTMGGSVRVETDLGQGSTFLCSLPAPRCAPPPRTRGAGPLRLLVIDDQEMNRDMLRLLLESRGHRVFSACSAQEALELLRGGGLSLDLAICDLHMPKMTGWDLASAWREVEAMEALPRLPILGLTASTVKEEHAQALALGMDHVVSKPLRAEALEELVTRMVRG